MTGPDSLAGTLTLQPGPTLPNVRSTRTGWVRAVTRGRRAAELPDLLAAVLPLCGDAHRDTAHAAIAAAGGASTPGRDERRALQLDTLREQLRHIWLDWPHALRDSAVAAHELAALRDCPVLRREVAPEAGLAAMPAWLAAHVLDLDPSKWLSAWDVDPPGWLDAWSQRAGSLPAQWLMACRDAARELLRVPQPLRVHADGTSLIALAQRLQADARFALAPRWQDAALETGPWTRLNDARPERYDSAWLRLGARLAEAVRLEPAGRGGPQRRALAAPRRPRARTRRRARLVRNGARPAGAPRGARRHGRRGAHRRVRRARTDGVELPPAGACRRPAARDARQCRRRDRAPAGRSFRPLRPCADRARRSPAETGGCPVHEMSLAGGVLDLVERTAEREGFARVSGMRLEVGKLSGVEVESLRFALTAIAPGTRLEGARIDIDEPPGQAWCMDCARLTAINERGDACGHCGGWQLQPTGGTGAAGWSDLLVDDG